MATGLSRHGLRAAGKTGAPSGPALEWGLCPLPTTGQLGVLCLDWWGWGGADSLAL